MFISDLTYLEDAVEASSVVGGEHKNNNFEYFYYKHCKKEKHFDEHEHHNDEHEHHKKYTIIYKCWDPYVKHDGGQVST